MDVAEAVVLGLDASLELVEEVKAAGTVVVRLACDGTHGRCPASDASLCMSSLYRSVPTEPKKVGTASEISKALSPQGIPNLNH